MLAFNTSTTRHKLFSLFPTIIINLRSIMLLVHSMQTTVGYHFLRRLNVQIFEKI